MACDVCVPNITIDQKDRLHNREVHGDEIRDFTEHPPRKTRHVGLKLLYMQNQVNHGLASTMKVPGAENVVDLWTKYLHVKALDRIREELGHRQ